MNAIQISDNKTLKLTNVLSSPLTIAYYPPRKNGGQNFKKYR